MSGIIFVNRNGLRWRGCASGLWAHKTLYSRWKRWSEAGVFVRMMEGLSGVQAERRTVIIEATYLKVHRSPRHYSTLLAMSPEPSDQSLLMG